MSRNQWAQSGRGQKRKQEGKARQSPRRVIKVTNRSLSFVTRTKTVLFRTLRRRPTSPIEQVGPLLTDHLRFPPNRNVAGKVGAFWGGFWGLLFGSAAFAIPGLGPILVAGPLVGWIIAGLEGAAVVGGVSAVGAGLVSIGIPKDSVVKYEVALKTDKFVLVVHGTPRRKLSRGPSTVPAPLMAKKSSLDRGPWQAESSVDRLLE